MGLPLPPFHGLQTVALQTQDRIAAGLVGGPEQEVAHVHPVDLPVGGYFAAAGGHQGGEKVDQVDHFVADLAGGDMPWPADQARCPV